MTFFIGDRKINHIALYLRISQEKKSENVETLENHRRLLTDYARNNAMTFVEFGEVVSGGKTEIEDRPQLRKLLQDIEQFDAILVVELSRLSRNGLISQTVKQYCIDYDKPILTPYGQVYDLANQDNDRLMFDVGAMISSHEHGVIGKRSKTNKMQMAKQGLHVSGGVPFGYRREPKTKKLYIVEDEAVIIRRIFTLHSQGLGSFKIRDILNDEGYKSATGKFFNIPTIKRILKNVTYKGWTFFNDRKRVKKNGKVTYEIVDTIIVKDTHPAIIPPEKWDKANRDREERSMVAAKIKEKPSVKTGITMLKDLVYCGCCGRKMSIKLDSKSATGYVVSRCRYLENGKKCPNIGVRVEFLEEDVIEDLSNYLVKCKNILEELKDNDTDNLKKEQSQNLKRYINKLADVKSEEKNLLRLSLKGMITDEEFREEKQQLIDQKESLKTQIDNLQKAIANPSVKTEIVKYENIIKVVDRLPQLPPESANEELKTLVKKVLYTRVLPEEILKLSTRNETRKFYPFTTKIEYFE